MPGVGGILRGFFDNGMDLLTDFRDIYKTVFNNPDRQYKHNLQVTVFEQTPGIVSTNLWDDHGVFNKNFICPEAAGNPSYAETSWLTGDLDAKPRIQFNRNLRNVHARMVDKYNGKVHWDVIYDLGGEEDSNGIETVFNAMLGEEETSIPNWSDSMPLMFKWKNARVGGTQQDFLTICPPKEDPPHWYELSFWQEGIAPSMYTGKNQSLLGMVTLIETHPMDVPTGALAHKEQEIIAQVAPDLVMFGSM